MNWKNWKVFKISEVMKNKIRIAMITSYFDRNGVTAQVLNYSTHIDPDKFEITIIAGEPFDQGYELLCKSKNISLMKLPKKQDSPYAYYKKVANYLKQGKYDIVHVHGSSATISVELLLAKLVKIPVRIAHSHNTTCSHIKIHKLLQPILKRVYTHAFACGELAGKWLFGKKQFSVITNAFETSKFIFNLDSRRNVRTELNINNKFVVGHIGKFNDQKNHIYLLEIFERLAIKNQNAILLLVGVGPDLDKIRAKVKNSPFQDRIIFYGETNEPANLYSAMDVFILPSKYEGLPIVLLEAQISGLSCIVSDKVTKEVDFGAVSWLSIEEDPEVWADHIMDVEMVGERDGYFAKHYQQVYKYDIEKCAKYLESLYIKAYNNFRKGINDANL